MLPEIDGFQFLREFRDRGLHESIPAVVVTATDQEEVQRRTLREQAPRIIAKGGSYELEIREAVRRMPGRGSSTP